MVQYRVDLKIAEGPWQGTAIWLWRYGEWLMIGGLSAQPVYAHLSTVRIQYVPHERGNSPTRIFLGSTIATLLFTPIGGLAAAGALAAQRRRQDLIYLAYRTAAAEVSLLLTDKSPKRLGKAYEELIMMLS